MRRLSIRLKLTLAHTLLFAGLLSVLGVAAYRVMRLYRYDEVDRQVLDRDLALRRFLQVEGDKASWNFAPDDAEQDAFRVRAARFYQLFNDKGKLLNASRDAEILDIPFTEAAQHALMTRQPQWETLSFPGGLRLRVLNTPFVVGQQGPLYLFRLAASLEPVDRAQRQSFWMLLVLLSLTALVAAASGWWMAGRALRRVEEIRGDADQITASDLSRRLSLVGSGDEMDALSATLNRMIARLEDSFAQMRQFLSNVSHELRTPLAALRSECEVGLRTASSERDYREILASNIQELDRLSRTVSSLLTLAQAEAGQVSVKRGEEDLGQIVTDAVEVIRPFAEERGVTFGVSVPARVMASVDADQVLRLLLNLLDNAVKFNRPRGRVDVSLETKDSWTVVSVRDTGHGIPAEHLPHLFERFHRIRTDETRGIEGLGIGLSLAQWITAAHGGRIEVESTAGEGSCFRVWLPRIHSAAGQALERAVMTRVRP